MEHNTAFVFPGQGSQYPGMGKDVFEAYPVARRVFGEIDDALGFPISQLCCEGREAQLNLTANTQPATLPASAAIHPVFEDPHALRPDLAPGPSLAGHRASG